MREPPQSKRTLQALCVSLIQADASYFRIDLPNSGMVILDKPLDYETKTQLQVVIVAVVCEPFIYDVLKRNQNEGSTV